MRNLLALEHTDPTWRASPTRPPSPMMHNRYLLQAAAPGGIPQTTTESSLTNTSASFVATTAYELVRVRNVRGEYQPIAQTGLILVSGEKVKDITFMLRDALGRRVQGAIPDANMPIQAKLYLQGANNTLKPEPNTGVVGDTVDADNGIVVFQDLEVILRDPSLPYVLRFESVKGLPKPAMASTKSTCQEACETGFVSEPRPVRDLKAQPSAPTVMSTQAQAGQPNSTTQAKLICREKFVCTECKAPLYSFYPNATTCSACPARADCHGHYVLPRNGSFQSHPRSPLVHKCLVAEACVRHADAIENMTRWADDYKNYSTRQIPADQAARYNAWMCQTGYTSPLCGACIEGYGRVSGGKCRACRSRVDHAVFYVLVCLLMLVWVGIQGIMHMKQVRKNHNIMLQQGIRHFGRQAATAQQQAAAAAAQAASNASPGQATITAMQPVATTPFKGVGTAYPAAAAAADVILDVQDTAHDDQQPLGSATSLTLASPWVAAAGASPVLGHGPSTGAAADDTDHGADDQALPPALGAYASAELSQLSSGNSPAAALAQPSSALPAAAATASGQPQPQAPGLLSVLFSVETIREPGSIQIGPQVVTAAATASPAAGSSNQSSRIWVSDVFKLLTSHLQMLGLLRSLRVTWPPVLQQALQFADPTSSITIWARLDCSLGDTRLMRKSVLRSIVVLLSPVVALLAVTVIWGLWVLSNLRRHGIINMKGKMVPRLILYYVLVLFFLYPQVSKEIVSVFSSQHVDKVDDLPPEASCPNCNLTDATAALLWQGSYWTSDMLTRCWQGPHLLLALALGVTGLVFFAVGLPVSWMWLLYRRRHRLTEYRVEVPFGPLYSSYRSKYYFWECVVLLEKLAVVVVITLLQGLSVSLQVLVAIAVIVVDASLQVTFQPFACRMLDTLQRLSFYSLEVTLFLLMVATLSEVATETTKIWVLAVISLVNLAVLGVFVAAIIMELKRLLLATLDRDQKGHLTWQDFRVYLHEKVQRLKQHRIAREVVTAVESIYGRCIAAFRVASS